MLYITYINKSGEKTTISHIQRLQSNVEYIFPVSKIFMCAVRAFPSQYKVTGNSKLVIKILLYEYDQKKDIEMTLRFISFKPPVKPKKLSVLWNKCTL